MATPSAGASEIDASCAHRAIETLHGPATAGLALGDLPPEASRTARNLSNLVPEHADLTHRGRFGARLLHRWLPLRKPGHVGDVLEHLLRRTGDVGAAFDDLHGGHLPDRLARRCPVSAERAGDIVYTVCGQANYLALVGDCGWTEAAYEQWLTETLVAALLPRV